MTALGLGGYSQCLPASGRRAVPREHRHWLPAPAEHRAGVKAGVTSRRDLVTTGVPRAGRSHAHPLPLLPADNMGKAEGAAPTEPGDPDGSEPGAISLRPVESISDLHWASGGHKGAEGNGPAPSRSLHRPPPHPVPSGILPLLPTLRPMPAAGPCPCLGPGHPLLLAILGLLALASLVLATLAIYLSVLQSQSVRALAQWLESQEDAVRQLRVASRQLWARLNASAEPSGHR
ncbi:leucine-rich single-pass membrane protein 2 [Alca torda]